MAAALKYRISLTSAQIYNLLLYVPEEDKEIRKILELAHFKASKGMVIPSHISTGRPSVDVSLGFTEDSTPADLYDLWNRGIKLSQSQLEIVETYRWTSGLMSPEEEEAYVSKLHSNP